MNYKFLSALTLAVCISNHTIADTAIVKAVDAPRVDIPKNVSAEIQKFGYVDYRYILETLPEGKKAEMDIQSFEKQLSNQLETKYNEYKEKAEDVQRQLDTLTEAQKKQKILEMNKLQEHIQQLEGEKYAKYTTKYNEVMVPLLNRIQKAMDQVMEEYNYDFILSKNAGDMSPILHCARQKFNLSDLVVKKFRLMHPEVPKLPVVGPVKNTATKVAPAHTPKQAAKGKSQTK